MSQNKGLLGKSIAWEGVGWARRKGMKGTQEGRLEIVTEIILSDLCWAILRDSPTPLGSSILWKEGHITREKRKFFKVDYFSFE